jgi:hypothetical protein
MVEVVEDGKKRRVSVQDAAMRRLVNEAIGRGNMAAMKTLFGLLTLVDPTVETENEQREREDAKASLLLNHNRMAERMRAITLQPGA